MLRLRALTLAVRPLRFEDVVLTDHFQCGSSVLVDWCVVWLASQSTPRNRSQSQYFVCNWDARFPVLVSTLQLNASISWKFNVSSFAVSLRTQSRKWECDFTRKQKHTSNPPESTSNFAERQIAWRWRRRRSLITVLCQRNIFLKTSHSILSSKMRLIESSSPHPKLTNATVNRSTTITFRELLRKFTNPQCKFRK